MLLQKKKRAMLLLILLVFLSLFPFSSCKRAAKPKSETFYGYFDTAVTIYDYSGGSDTEFSKNCVRVTELLKYYHRLFDIYNEYEGITNVATLNSMAGAGAVKVDGELIDFLEYSKEMYELTSGNVNIAMGAVLSIWHDYREAAKESPETATLPPRELLLAASEHCDVDKLKIDRENSTVELLDAEMSLDVGAIAKGYAAERAAELLMEIDCTSYVLDLGGNLRIIGTKTDGSSWRTGVRNPDTASSDPYVYYFDAADTSVVTSGDYQRYYSVNGKKYHHIINKDTLMPSEYFASVTVVTKNSGLADALSTALFNMDLDSGITLLDSLDSARAVWVLDNGEIKTYGFD